MTKIELRRVGEGYHLEASNDVGNLLHMDASPDIGGTDQGMRPMQVLLAALGGCSTIDVISILKKQKQDLRDIRITVSGEREQGAVPSLYTEIHLHFKLYGNVDREKAQKAVSLSVDKYCSVAKTLEKTAKITYDVEVLP